MRLPRVLGEDLVYPSAAQERAGCAEALLQIGRYGPDVIEGVDEENMKNWRVCYEIQRTGAS